MLESTACTAPDEGGKESKDFIRRGYKGREDNWHEEFFVGWLGKAMADGTVDEMKQYLDAEGQKELDNLLKALHYDIKQETTARQQGWRTSQEGVRGNEFEGARGVLSEPRDTVPGSRRRADVVAEIENSKALVDTFWRIFSCERPFPHNLTMATICKISAA